MEELEHLDELGGVRGLDQVGVGAGLVGAVDVDFIAGGGQRHHQQGVQHRLLANPLEDFKAAADGEVQVQQHDIGHGELFAVGVGARAGQVIQRGLAIANHYQPVGQAGLVEGAVHEEHVIVFVFDVEITFAIRASVRFNSANLGSNASN